MFFLNDLMTDDRMTAFHVFPPFFAPSEGLFRHSFRPCSMCGECTPFFRLAGRGVSLPLPASDGGWCVAFSASLQMPPRLIGCVEAVFGRCGLKAQPAFEPGIALGIACVCFCPPYRGSRNTSSVFLLLFQSERIDIGRGCVPFSRLAGRGVSGRPPEALGPGH